MKKSAEASVLTLRDFDWFISEMEASKFSATTTCWFPCDNA